MIFAIDPGDIKSGYCILSDDLSEIIEKDKIDNYDLLDRINFYCQSKNNDFIPVIEMIKSYGMSVGETVFDTCVWIGRIKQFLIDKGFKEDDINYIYRYEEKLYICHSPKANDTTIRQALIDRFAKGVKNYGKGTKKEPGFFYGFGKDMWSAFAVAVTYHDKKIEKEITDKYRK